MLNYGVWSKEGESIVIDAQKHMARAILNMGEDVIIDDTNISKQHEDMWGGIARECGADFIIKEFETSVEECIERNKNRHDSVPREAIIGMALNSKSTLKASKEYMDKNTFIICDIDGTVADTSKRLHHLDKTPKDWGGFFSDMINDAPRQEIIDELKANAGRRKVLFVSGRPDNYRNVTEEWLNKNIGIEYEALFMRKRRDTRPDDIIKLEIFNNYLKGIKDNIQFVYDDRPRVIRMWREVGLEVTDVGDGVEF